MDAVPAYEVERSQRAGGIGVAEAERHRILVVEDDEAVRELVASHLRKRQYVVEVAGSAEDVLRALRERRLEYDVALTDVHLPRLSGVELARLLLARSPLRPVVMITGDADQELARRALDYGATGYLLKPFELFELDAALAQAVSMLELVETTETLARSQAEHLDEWGEAGGMLPGSWLHLGDEQSGAGSGHGARVARIAGLLAKIAGSRMDAGDGDVLRTAARTHEIGRVVVPSARGDVPRRTAQLLDDLGFDPGVGELVRQAGEPWSPGLPLAARILALSDRLDHHAVRESAAGREDADAARAAVDAVSALAGEQFDPELVRVLEAERERIESMWVSQREAAP